MFCSISPTASISAIRTPSPLQVSQIMGCVKDIPDAADRLNLCVIAAFSNISSGAVLALTCAVMLLNTDLHGQVKLTMLHILFLTLSWTNKGFYLVNVLCLNSL